MNSNPKMADSNIFLEVKYDYQLTKKEIVQLAELYAEVFYENQKLNTTGKKMIQESLSKYNIWQWFLLKEKKTKKIIGMGSFIYSFDALHNPKIPKLDVSEEFQENIGNIGVSPLHRRKGYAHLIMNEILKMHNDQILTLEIKRNSPIASVLLKFYSHLGFRVHGKTEEGLFLRLKPSS